MSNTIKNHVSEEEEEEERWEIQVVQVFTKEAWDSLKRGNIRVDGAKVVVDCMTNDVWGTRAQRQAEPGELVERLRRVIGEAEGIVVCEVKPMQHIDVVISTPGSMAYVCIHTDTT